MFDLKFEIVRKVDIVESSYKLVNDYQTLPATSSKLTPVRVATKVRVM
jgi:hypothetical protein